MCVKGMIYELHINFVFLAIYKFIKGLLCEGTDKYVKSVIIFWISMYHIVFCSDAYKFLFIREKPN